MFTSPIELITPATTNSLFAFCLCNLIVVVLLVSGSKPASDDVQDSTSVPPTVAYEDKSKVEELKGPCLSSGKVGVPTTTSEFSDVNGLLVSGSKPILDDVQDCVAVPRKCKTKTEELKDTCLSSDESVVDTQAMEAGLLDTIIHEENERENEEGEDELRRRIEEFIEETNRRWKEEKLRAYYLELEIAAARS